MADLGIGRIGFDPQVDLRIVEIAPFVDNPELVASLQDQLRRQSRLSLLVHPQHRTLPGVQLLRGNPDPLCSLSTLLPLLTGSHRRLILLELRPDEAEGGDLDADLPQPLIHIVPTHLFQLEAIAHQVFHLQAIAGHQVLDRHVSALVGPGTDLLHQFRGLHPTYLSRIVFLHIQPQQLALFARRIVQQASQRPGIAHPHRHAAHSGQLAEGLPVGETDLRGGLAPLDLLADEAVDVIDVHRHLLVGVVHRGFQLLAQAQQGFLEQVAARLGRLGAYAVTQ